MKDVPPRGDYRLPGVHQPPSYAQHRRGLVAALIPKIAAVTIALTGLYAIGDLASGERSPTLLCLYVVQFTPLLLSAWLVRGWLRAYPEMLVLGADVIYTAATASRLLAPDTTMSGTALVLSLKLVATALLVPWPMAFQGLSAAATLTIYGAVLAISGHPLRWPDALHQLLGPVIAAVLSVTGTLILDGARQSGFIRGVALGDRERRLRLLLEQLPAVVWTTDTDLRFASGAGTGLERIVDVGANQIGVALAEYFQNADPDFAPLAAHRRALNGESITYEMKWRGRTFHCHVEALHGEEGSIIGTIGVALDTTEHAEAEAGRQQEAQVARALVRVSYELMASLNTAQLGDSLCRVTTEVLGCDSSDTLLWQEKDAAYTPVAAFGFTPEQWESLRLLKIPVGTLGGILPQLERGEVVQVQPHAFTGVLRGLLDQYAITRALYVAVWRGSDLIGFHAAHYRGRAAQFSALQERIFHGIANLASLALENARLVDELTRASRVKSEFVATMSHELRTPLSVILGYTDLMLEEELGTLNPEQAEILQRIRANSRELLDLINATLDMSRLEAGQMPLDVREVVIGDLLHEIDGDTRDLQRRKPIEFSWNVAPDLPRVETDPVKLKVVVKNLIGNAVKFTEHGSVSVDACVCDGGIEIAVADTGVGISAESLPIIFEPFRQGDSSMTRRFEGVGLGLYIVSRLLNLLGGTIAVESEVGRGSTFRVRLPQHVPA